MEPSLGVAPAKPCAEEEGWHARCVCVGGVSVFVLMVQVAPEILDIILDYGPTKLVN